MTGTTLSQPSLSTSTCVPAARERRLVPLLRAHWQLLAAAAAMAVIVMWWAGAAGAAGADTTSVYQATTPCRLADTRPAGPVGDRVGALGPGERHTFQIHGSNGNCTIATNVTAVNVNVTPVGWTAISYLTVTPEGGELPLSSTVNGGPGALPTPNEVTVKLNNGAIDVYNAFGNVNVVLDISGVYTPAPTGGGGDLAALEARVAELETLLEGVSRVSLDGQPTMRFSNMNVQLVDGTGDTDGDVNGRGNLIVGYNESGGGDDRSGSHNLVVGDQHTYSSSGGVVFGTNNAINGEASVVTGGSNNLSSGAHSAVAGGSDNTASGLWASVSGGIANEAAGPYAAVLGGWGNEATGNQSAVVGGHINNAVGSYAAVVGGYSNDAVGLRSAVLGGHLNGAIGERSVVAGGAVNTASGNQTAVLGGVLNDAVGQRSSVAGGQENVTSATASSIVGGVGNEATGSTSAILGGRQNTASGAESTVAGGDGVVCNPGVGQRAVCGEGTLGPLDP